MRSETGSAGIGDLRARLRRREVSAVELAREALDRIAARDGELNAVVRLRAEAALAEAAARDRDPGNDAPLWGVPVLIKDNLALEGQEVTACSRILEGFVAPYTATAVERLRAAGAVILGQTNMDEFAMGSSTEHSALGPARNPVDPARVPGGSSGGSAAAVAAGYVPLALGSDTGGSIRQPAAFCGVVGLKPTYGRVSRWGLFAYASSLDQVGTFARSVEDAALGLEAIEGQDPRDATSAPAPAPLRPFDQPVAGLRIGLPREFMDTAKGLRPAVRDLVRAALARLEAEGAVVEEISLPILDHVIPTYYLIANAEASSNLARYDGVRYGRRAQAPADLEDCFGRTRAEGFGEEARNRVLLGTYALSAGYADAFYKKAEALRGEMRSRLAAVLGRVDVVAGPTTPDTAFRLGEKTGDPLAMYAQDLYTTFANLTQAPAVSVPCGLADGLPVGLQFVGRLFDERTVLRAALAVQRTTP